MKVLVLGFGNATGRFNPPSTHCENFISRNMGEYEIITFGYNEGVDVIIHPEDDFKTVLEQLPQGWMPDYCLLWLAEWNLLPRGIECAPFPTVAWLPDWDYNVPYTKTCAESVDLIISHGEPDSKAIRTFTGINNAVAFHAVGVMQEYFAVTPKKIKDRKFDVLYTTWIDDAIQPGRSAWICKLCSLSDRYTIHIDKNLNYPEYIALLRDSKLVLSYNRHGSIAVRVADAGAQGAVVLDPGEEIKQYFTPNEEYIPITVNDFAEQIERYLKNEKTLQKMADKFYKKVTENYEAGKRFIEMLRFAEKCLKNKISERRFNLYTEGDKCMRRGENYYYAYFSGAPGVFFSNPGSRLLKLSAEEFKKALAIKSAPRCLMNLAMVKSAFDFLFHKEEILKNKAKEIIPLFEKIISLYPSYAMAYFHMGIVHFRVGNYQEALHTFSEALRIIKNECSDFDSWCLQSREYNLFNSLLRSPLNANLISLCGGQDENAEMNIRKLYQSIILYLIATIEEENRSIHKGLKACLESYNLYSESGVIAWKAAGLLANLSFKDESILLYKRAINLLPLSVDLRIEYIKLLYAYEKDNELVQELKDAFKITKTVIALREKAKELKTLFASFKRFNSDSCYSQYDTKELLLDSWVETLFFCLRANPKDINLVLRIVEIWNELGKTDKVVELMDNYTANYFNKYDLDHAVQARLADIYDNLTKRVDTDSKIFVEKLSELKNCFAATPRT